MTTLGGKAGRPTAPGLLVEPREAPEAEALAPLADDLPGRVEPRGDDIIAQALGGQEDDLGSDDIPIR
jgi:hypothetical protein